MATDPPAGGANQALDHSSVLRRVDAGRSAASHDHSNSYSILKRAQLLERFGLFERRDFPADETKKEITPVAVNPLVPKILRVRCVPPKGDRCPRKIERVPVSVHDHFYLVRRLGLARILERMRGCDHLQVPVVL